MPSIVWCDRVRREVEESRTEIVDNILEAIGGVDPPGFIYVTPRDGENQVLLSVAHISSVEAAHGSGV